MARPITLLALFILSAITQVFCGDLPSAPLTFRTDVPTPNVSDSQPQPSEVAAWADKPENGIHFQENLGQVKDMNGDAAPYVRFMLERGGAKIFLLEQGIAWQFERVHYPEGYTERKAALQDGVHDQAMERIAEELARLEKQIRLETYRMDMTLVGADPHARVTTEGRSNDYTNYYNHNVMDVHHYRRVRYHDVYPGINWVVYTTEAGMKYDFELQPGADPSLIKLQFSQHEELYLDEQGRLVVGNRMGRFVEEAPLSYQEGSIIETQFLLNDDIIQFRVKNFDHSLPLVIYPERIWSTYYGGTNMENGMDCAADIDGNIYLSGSTQSTTNIALNGHQNIYTSGYGGFLVKFNSFGTRLWGTYYPGSGTSCATSYTGDVYLSGGVIPSTPDLVGYQGFMNEPPPTPGNPDTWQLGGIAYLAKFNSQGSRIWSTYYPFIFGEAKCETDNVGNVYLLGRAVDDPILPNIAYNGHQVAGGGGFDLGLVKFNSSGGRIWATYYGGEGVEAYGPFSSQKYDLHVDAFDNVYLASTTESFNNISSNGHQMFHGEVGSSNRDAFLVKFNPSGERQWATYYGGAGEDTGISVWTDEFGYVYLLGSTNSNINIWQDGVFQSGPYYIAKFSPNGVRQWGTYAHGDIVAGISDSDGYFFTAGNAEIINLATPITNTYAYEEMNIMVGLQTEYGGGLHDWFLIRWQADGVPVWGTYYGGGGTDKVSGIAAANEGSVYFAGSTASGGLGWQGHQNAFSVGVDGLGNLTHDVLLVKLACVPQTSTTDISTCDTYDWNGNTYTQTGSYTFETVTAFGCDSTAVLSLSIATANTAFSLQGSTVTANATDAAYQWVDCNNGNAPIFGATGQSFTPEVSGSYAVEVTQNGCVGLSACVAITVVGIEENEALQLSIRPNPSDGLLYVEVGTGLAGAPYTVVDALGHIVQTGRLEGTRKVLDLNDVPAGIYSITLGDGFKVTERIVKL